MMRWSYVEVSVSTLPTPSWLRARGSAASRPLGHPIAPTPTIAPWPGHEPRDRHRRADGAGVRDRHGRTGEVVGDGLAGLDLAHEVLVGEDEGAEVERVGVLHDRDEERPASRRPARRRPRARDRRGRGGRPRGCPCRRPTSTNEELSDGHLLERAEDGEADEVREGDPRARRPREVLVQRRAIDLEEPGGHRADARRGRDREGRLHVRRDAPRRSAQRDGASVLRVLRAVRRRWRARR